MYLVGVFKNGKMTDGVCFGNSAIAGKTEPVQPCPFLLFQRWHGASRPLDIYDRVASGNLSLIIAQKFHYIQKSKATAIFYCIKRSVFV